MSPVELEMRLTDHPRARAGIRRAKGAAGLGVFLLVILLSWRAGLPRQETGVRALGAGVAAYFVAWALAVNVWRQVALGELEAARARRAQRLASLTHDFDG